MIIADSDTALSSQLQPESAKRVRRSRRQWKALLEEFSSSGLSKTAFCKKHRIATSSLYRWQQLLSQDAGGIDFIDVTEPLSSTPVAPFVHERDNTWQVELELGPGIVLRLRTI
jgi:transposase-like protein